MTNAGSQTDQEEELDYEDSNENSSSSEHPGVENDTSDAPETTDAESLSEGASAQGTMTEEMLKKLLQKYWEEMLLNDNSFFQKAKDKREERQKDISSKSISVSLSEQPTVNNNASNLNKSTNVTTDDLNKDTEILKSPSNTTVWARVVDMNLDSSDEVNTSSDIDMSDVNNHPYVGHNFC